MKKAKNIKSIFLFGAVAISASILYYSCAKPEPGGPATAANSQQVVVSKGQTFANQISRIKIVNNNGKIVGSINAKTAEFSFADPGDGFHFSTNNGWEFVKDGSGGTIYIATGAFNSNSGGTVVAGSTSLDINFTFCLSASDASNGFKFGPDTSNTGVSLVIGIDGDLAAMAKGGSGQKIEDMFHGLAMFLIYSKQAQGKYEVVNWIDNHGSTSFDSKNKGFAWVMDFKSFSLYFSKEGTLNVNGGTIDFAGKYLQFSPDAKAKDIFDFGKNPTVTTVDGVGSMGCN